MRSLGAILKTRRLDGWTPVSLPTASYYGIYSNGSYWVAVGTNSGVNKIVHSDGPTPEGTWHAATYPTVSGAFMDVHWSGTHWAAVYNEGIVYKAGIDPSGIWSNNTLGTYPDWRLQTIYSNGSYWVAAGGYQAYSKGMRSYISGSDPSGSWSTVFNTSTYYKRVIYNGSYWAAVGSERISGKDYASVDYIAGSNPAGTWANTLVIPDMYYQATDIYHNGSYWVVPINRTLYGSDLRLYYSNAAAPTSWSLASISPQTLGQKMSAIGYDAVDGWKASGFYKAIYSQSPADSNPGIGTWISPYYDSDHWDFYNIYCDGVYWVIVGQRGIMYKKI